MTQENKPFVVGLFGFGVIGAGVVKTLQRNGGVIAERLGRPVKLKRVADVDLKRDRGVKVPRGVLTDRPEAILDDPEIECVVELIGGVKCAGPIVESALKKKKHVVTANKELVSKRGAGLLRLAARNGVELRFEASVGGGIPILSPLSSCLKANRVLRMAGIINGTTNYILDRMLNANLEFAEALREAQALGYAEADPTNDVEGFDAAYKATILAGLVYGKAIPADRIHREGISRIDRIDMLYAREMGYAVKLLAHVSEAGDGGVDVRVHPTLLPKGHPLARVDGVLNAVWMKADPLGALEMVGEGAGPSATSSAVLGDVIEIASGAASGGARAREWTPGTSVPIESLSFPFYTRMIVKDQPGVMAAVTRVLGEQKVSISSMVQKGLVGDRLAEVVIITHRASERAMRRSVSDIRKLNAVRSVENVIRVMEGEA